MSGSGSPTDEPRHGLIQLHPTADTPTEFDIVAIHGLDGDAYQSWTYPGTQTMWIRDFLKDQYPRARIFTFGYDVGRVWFSTGIMNVETVAGNLLEILSLKMERPELPVETRSKRPIIFICHSLGGIILKTAMVKANDERNNYGFIFNHPKAVVFMATPHLGSKLADVVDILTKLPLPAMFKDKRNIKLLKSHSRELLELSRRFRERAGDFEAIVSYFETKRLPGMRAVVVDDHSSTLSIPGERIIGLSADHHSICKFKSPTDHNYELVFGRLDESIRKLLGNNPIGLLEAPEPDGDVSTMDTELGRAHDLFAQRQYNNCYKLYREMFQTSRRQPSSQRNLLVYLGIVRCLVRIYEVEENQEAGGGSDRQRHFLKEAAGLIDKMLYWEHPYDIGEDVSRHLVAGLEGAETDLRSLRPSAAVNKMIQDLGEIKRVMECEAR